MCMRREGTIAGALGHSFLDLLHLPIAKRNFVASGASALHEFPCDVANGASATHEFSVDLANGGSATHEFSCDVAVCSSPNIFWTLAARDATA